MLNLELIKELLMIATASSIVTTASVQKIKEAFIFKKSSRLVIVSFVVSMIFGTLFGLTFGGVEISEALWVGFFSFIGADVIYKTFEDKIFKSFGTIVENNKEIVEKEYIIK